ncbi:unnamed protein product [Xylocopa violacea]|uniref:Palmitoyl-protein thioesterase 1 n=1 Tax=Xylocopa violacea TaxID=135666 RepID=A0ABP1MZR1_XYLVO
MFTLDKQVLLLLFVCIYKFNGIESATPVVMWHGMGDSCCFSFSLGRVKKLIESVVPNVYVYSIRLGDNEIVDVEHSYFGNINKQIQEVCQLLSNDEKLKDGYNAIGFSQGGQFLRAIAQRCPNPPIKNLISLGGQQQGVFGLPSCGAMSWGICNYINRVVKYGAYLQFTQEKLVQATFWHDPYQEAEYRNKSIFMAEINNERYINETYKENLQKLQNMVLVKFENDSIVRPTETEWFGFYKPGQDKEVLTFKETHLYSEDRLGLQMLYESDRIQFLSVPGDHLQFTEDWFIDNIINKYLL